MGLEDALPDRPLFDNELDELGDGLPDEYDFLPGSALDFGTGAQLYPTFTIKSPDGTVTLFGRSQAEEKWMKIETWSADEYDPDEQAATVHEWAEDHLPDGSVDWTVDMG